jgi:glycosyltransferase involved in cell wall biosynthesis
VSPVATLPPLVTIGLPVHNGAEYLEEALASLRAQTYPRLEIVIGDNGSTDATPSICRRAAAVDPRIRYLPSPENRGAAWNYNRVFQEAAGEFFMWAAHDDVRAPRAVERCVQAFLDEGPDVVVVYPGAVFIDVDGTELGPDHDRPAAGSGPPHVRLARLLMSLNMAHPVFGLIRSSALRQTRLIDRFVASDYVLLAELALLGRFVHVPEPLFLRRVHHGSSRAANRSRASVTAWFDPRRRPDRLLTTRQRLVVEYTRSIGRLPLAPTERVLCWATVLPVVGYRRLRVVGGRWKARVRTWWRSR